MNGQAMILGGENGEHPTVLHPIPGLYEIGDDAQRWFGWTDVPTESRLRLDDGIEDVRHESL